MVDFEDTKTAFITKNDKQLRRAFWLFKLVGNQRLVSFGKWSSTMAFKIGLPIKGIVKRTVYEQFVGGETILECEDTVKELFSHGVYSILDYSVEGAKTETSFDRTAEKVIDTIKFASSHEGIPFAVFKVTGIGRFKLLEKVSAGELLSEKEATEFERLRSRVKRICESAKATKLKILIDAEESWIQPCIDNLAEEMMQLFNRDECIVYTTVQMYRHDRLEYLKKLHMEMKAKGTLCGIKVVRGAYMEKERERAEDMGYPDPIQVNKAATDADYNSALTYIMNNIGELSLVAGSHNEDSTGMLTQLIEEKGISKSDENIWFSQLFGMSDNLSFNLAKAGFKVVKYLPFGPVKETLPYLIRRAEENTSAGGQTSRELKLIQREIKRRKSA